MKNLIFAILTMLCTNLHAQFMDHVTIGFGPSVMHVQQPTLKGSTGRSLLMGNLKVGYESNNGRFFAEWDLNAAVSGYTKTLVETGINFKLSKNMTATPVVAYETRLKIDIKQLYAGARIQVGPVYFEAKPIGEHRLFTLGLRGFLTQQ